MNFSADECLRWRTTKELTAILEYCLQETHYANYEHIILEILDVLNERYVPDPHSKTARRAREMLQKHTKTADQ